MSKKTKKPSKKPKVNGNKVNHKPTISVCLIVKNEERFLENCLKSVKDIADEIIIIDTGSTDNTVEIAKEYTDKVYLHTWENSFCKARNQVLKYATGEWILQIDADEELMNGSGEILRQTIKNSKEADVILVKIISPYDHGNKKSVHYIERLFRNNRKIHYEGNIHERVVGGTKAFYSDIQLWHCGYDLDETQIEQKNSRSIGIIKKEIENDPDNPLHRHYLGVTYLSGYKYQEAIDEAKKAISLLKPQHFKYQVFSATYYIISNAYYSMGQYELAKKYALEALDKFPGHIDSYYVLTLVAAKMDEENNVIKYGELFLEKIDSFSKKSSELNVMPHFTISEGPTAGVLIGHAYHASNNLSQMRKYYNKAFNISEIKWKVLWNIVVYHMEKSGDLNCAGEYLNLVLNEITNEYREWHILTEYCKTCGLTDKEIVVLEKLVETGINDDFVINHLFSLYREKEYFEKAYELLKSLKSINNSTYADILKLGNHFFTSRNLQYALQCYMKAVAIKPDNPEAWSILAEITLSLKRYEDCQVCIVKALEIKDNDLPNLLTMCELKLLSGDIESHVKYCDKILEILGLDRNRTIDNFGDLKNIFIEIGNSMNNSGFDCSSKITNIINKLETYISPAV